MNLARTNAFWYICLRIQNLPQNSKPPRTTVYEKPLPLDSRNQVWWRVQSKFIKIMDSASAYAAWSVGWLFTRMSVMLLGCLLENEAMTRNSMMMRKSMVRNSTVTRNPTVFNENCAGRCLSGGFVWKKCWLSFKTFELLWCGDLIKFHICWCESERFALFVIHFHKIPRWFQCRISQVNTSLA